MTEVGCCLGSVHYPCANCGEALPKKWGVYMRKDFAKFAIRVWICEDCIRLLTSRIDDKKRGE